MSSVLDRPITGVSRESAESGRFLFVDTIRFWSMFAVVAMHSTEAFRTKLPWLVQLVRTPAKFGTIGFFLISGFLLGGLLNKTSPVEYMKKRLKKVFLPWLFWLAVYSLTDFGLRLLEGQVVFTADLNGLRHIASDFRTAVVYTSFWFVPNLLIAMAVLLLFRRYLNSVRFGLVLMAITQFYSVNIYFGWLPVAHSEALLGFVFFLWLGNYAALHKDQFTQWAARIPLWALAVASVATLMLSFAETRILYLRGLVDPANTLRISNQIYAVIVVLALFKLRKASWPSIVDPPRQTFGIYLIHPTIFLLLIRAIFWTMAALHFTGDSLTIIICEWVFAAAATYSLALLASKGIGSVSWMQWSIGLGQSPKRPATRLPAYRPASAAAPYVFDGHAAAK